MNNSSYDHEITFNNFKGDMEIFDLGNKCLVEINLIKKQHYHGFVSKIELALISSRITDYFLEIEAIRENDYEKWYPFKYI